MMVMALAWPDESPYQRQSVSIRDRGAGSVMRKS